jgi:protoheme IX farnesyltransferase
VKNNDRLLYIKMMRFRTPRGASQNVVKRNPMRITHLADSPSILRVLSTRSSNELLASATSDAIANGENYLTMKERIKVYSQLAKARLSALVVMTTGAGFLMAGGPISWGSLAAVSVGTSLAAASASAFNQAWEVEMDSKMNRTCKRPLPSGKITRAHAVGFGATTAAFSTGILAAGCNPLTASLGLFNIGLYSLIYTPMKTRTELNTWVGSIVGAIPPVMGWAASTGSIISPEAALQAYLLFAWQMPHFFALSWRSRHDYARGGYKMVPCADPTGKRTASLVMRYSLYLAPIPIVASLCDATSYMFAVEGSVINAYALYLAHNFYKKPTNGAAQKVFLCSLWYLPVMLGCMVFHSQNWLSEEEKEGKKRSMYREAFLGEVDEDNIPLMESVVATDDNTSMSHRVVSKIRGLRQQLKQVCVHETLWGMQDGKRNPDQSSVLCPVHVGNNTVDTVALASKVSSKK